MLPDHPDGADPQEVAKRFLADSCELESVLGSGTDGIVYSTSRPSAIKVFSAPRRYQNELAAYLRLEEFKVTKICGHNVPVLLGNDDALLVIEMSRVVVPYVLDFGKSDVDYCLDFTDEELESRLEEQAGEFGEDWSGALDIYYKLRFYGIYYHDLSPRNIAFLRDEAM